MESSGHTYSFADRIGVTAKPDVHNAQHPKEENMEFSDGDGGFWQKAEDGWVTCFSFSGGGED